MVGFPKFLNSKFDYEFVRDNFPPEQWKPRFRELLDERMQWYNTGKLANSTDGVTDDTHKVITETAEGKTTHYQFELLENPDCRLHKLGYTVDEINEILKMA